MFVRAGINRLNSPVGDQPVDRCKQTPGILCLTKDFGDFVDSGSNFGIDFIVLFDSGLISVVISVIWGRSW